MDMIYIIVYVDALIFIGTVLIQEFINKLNQFFSLKDLVICIISLEFKSKDNPWV